MTTYYELIVFLKELTEKEEISDIEIDNFKKSNIYLEGLRYYRFLNNLTNTLDDRINNCFKRMRTIDETIDANEFTNEIELIRSESLKQIELITCPFIKEEDQNKLIIFIKTNNNEIIDRLINKYKEYESITIFLKNYYIN